VLLQGIIFDVDGTLVDSNDAHARCWLEAFEYFGKRFEYDEVFQHIGKGGDLLVPDLLNAKEMRKFGEDVKELRTKLYKNKYLPNVKPFPRVRELFEQLRGRDVRVALASSSDPDEVDHYTKLLGVAELIDGSTSKRDAEFSKPSPEIFRVALRRIGTDPDVTLTVGDTPYDILASHRAALPIAAVLSGGFQRDQLNKADFLFADVAEIVRKLDIIDAYFHE
jgi:HAD superfamily hydrolase (TIGR01549 family)